MDTSMAAGRDLHEGGPRGVLVSMLCHNVLFMVCCIRSQGEHTSLQQNRHALTDWMHFADGFPDFVNAFDGTCVPLV